MAEARGPTLARSSSDLCLLAFDSSFPVEHMATFTDKLGDTHTLDLDCGQIEDAKKELGIDLEAALAGDSVFVEVLYGKPGQLVSLLYLLTDAEKRGIAPEDWARRFNRAAIESSSQALMESVVDFFHPSRVAANVKTKLPAIRERAEAAINQASDRAFSRWLTESLVPSESAPAE